MGHGDEQINEKKEEKVGGLPVTVTGRKTVFSGSIHVRSPDSAKVVALVGLQVPRKRQRKVNGKLAENRERVSSSAQFKSAYLLAIYE